MKARGVVRVSPTLSPQATALPNRRALAALDVEDRSFLDEVTAEFQRLREFPLRMGRLLLAVRERVGHGAYEEYVGRVLGLSLSRARELKRLAQQPDAEKLAALGLGKFAPVLSLSVEQRARLLDDPATVALSYRELRERVAALRQRPLMRRITPQMALSAARLYLNPKTMTAELVAERYLILADLFASAKDLPESVLAQVRLDYGVLLAGLGGLATKEAA